MGEISYKLLLFSTTDSIEVTRFKIDVTFSNTLLEINISTLCLVKSCTRNFLTPGSRMVISTELLMSADDFPPF